MKIGIDIVNMVRVQNWYKKDKLMKKVFSANELKIIEEISGRRRIEFIAGRFAVKEAVIKAISAKHKLSLIEIETITLETGAPRLCLHGKTKDYVISLGLYEYMVSISHDTNYVVAIVALS